MNELCVNKGSKVRKINRSARKGLRKKEKVQYKAFKTMNSPFDRLPKDFESFPKERLFLLERLLEAFRKAFMKAFMKAF